MSDQPENTAVEPLPEPTADETLRLMRDGSKSLLPWWQRLLPPWVCSLGLHLFILPFVLIVTVTFADKLFVPTVWDDYRAEKLGNDPHYNLIVDRDYPVEQVEEKSVPFALVTAKQSAPSRPATGTGALKVPTTGVKTTLLDPLNVRADQGGLQVSTTGVKATVPATKVAATKRVPETAPAPADSKVASQPKQPQAGSDGNFVIDQPANSVPGGNQPPDVIYVPTPNAVVDAMLKVAKLQAGEVLFDPGCGDGRIPIAAVKNFNALGFGYDIDPERIKESLANASKQGIANRVVFERRDAFKLDFSKADVVALYMLPSLNVKLIPQLEKMKPGSRIVSHDFDMEGVTPDRVIEMDATDANGNKRTHMIYLWTTPLKKVPPGKPATRPPFEEWKQSGAGAQGATVPQTITQQLREPKAGSYGNIVINQPASGVGSGKSTGSRSTESEERGFLSKDESQLVELINDYRAQNQLPPLTPTAALSKKTRLWKANIGVRDGGGFFAPDRFCTADVGLTPEGAFSYWMKDGTSNPRITDKQFQYIGVSSGGGPNNNIYFAFFLSYTSGEK